MKPDIDFEMHRWKEETMQSARRILIAVSIVMLLSPSLFAIPGDTLKSIPSPGACPQGLTFDGRFLWTVDRLSDMIYKIDPALGTVVDSITAPGYVPRGLTWDGSLLWCADGNDDLIHGINPTSRVVERTLWCPVSNPNGLAWDGKYLWVCSYRGEEIHKISTEDGTTIKSIPAPGKNSCGLTFDGRYLWISDRIDDMIYMVTPDRGDVIVSMDSHGPHPWGLAWDGTNLWNVDYQTDLIYKLAVNDGTDFSHHEIKTQQIEFIHQVRNFGPGTVNTLDVYLAVPSDRDSQKLIGNVSFDPQPIDILTDRWGQKVAHFRFSNLGASDFTEVKMIASANLYDTRYYIFPENVGGLSDIPSSILNVYLEDDTKFSIYDPIIQNGTKAAIGEETNPYWIARKIYDYVIEHIEYERVGGWNIAPTVLDRGNGSCSEYSFVYIAMCRAAGLPARYVGSVVVRGDDASYDNVFHRWVEVYLPGYGWIPVDPSGGDSDSPSYRAKYFGHLSDRFLITTVGGGGSEYLEWNYNANERWTSQGKCNIEVENLGEWSPMAE